MKEGRMTNCMNSDTSPFTAMNWPTSRTVYPRPPRRSIAVLEAASSDGRSSKKTAVNEPNPHLVIRHEEKLGRPEGSWHESIHFLEVGLLRPPQ